MNSLIIDTGKNKIFLKHIVDKNIYTCSHENSKSNFDKLIILINDFLTENKYSINQIDAIYVNQVPGSFSGIRNIISTIKALFLTKKIDYYYFSFNSFFKSDDIDYKEVPNLCVKYNIKKNLINPVYLS